MQATIEAAPQLWDALGEESRATFATVQAGVAAAGIEYRVNPRLVRGLDYYNSTVFEWVTTRLGAQSAVCSGGRYDGLFEQLGGKPTPGCGFGIGVERIMLLLEDAGRTTKVSADAYVVHVGEPATRLALDVAENLRDAGLAIIVHAGGGSFKTQMKRADASGARYALIVGDDEAAANVVGVKALRETWASRSPCRFPTSRRASPRTRTTITRDRRSTWCVAPATRLHEVQARIATWQFTISKNRNNSTTSKPGGRTYGNTVSTVAVIDRVLAVAGLQGWRWWQRSKAEEAAVAVPRGERRPRGTTTRPRRRTRPPQLADQLRRHGRTRRAAALLHAKLLFDGGDNGRRAHRSCSGSSITQTRTNSRPSPASGSRRRC